MEPHSSLYLIALMKASRQLVFVSYFVSFTFFSVACLLDPQNR